MNPTSQRLRLLVFRPTMGQGGADRMTLTLVKELDRNLFDITLVLMRAEGEFLEDIPSDVELINLNSASLWTAWVPLAKFLRRNSPDIILSPCGGASLPATVAWMLSGARPRLVLSERNVLFRGEYSPKRILLALSKAVLFRYADEITTVSQGVAEDLRYKLHLPPERISTSYNPVVSEEIERLAEEPVDHPWFHEGVPIVLAVGRLVPQKDYDTLLTAFFHVLKTSQARLVILGEGVLEAQLRDRTITLGIQDNVFFVGFDKNPFKFMSKCSVFVLSSQAEGLPGSLIQAMACGAPAVATDCHAGPSEIIQNGTTGFLVPVGDARQLADRINLLLRDPMLREQIAEAGRCSVERFRVSTSVRAYTRALVGTPAGVQKSIDFVISNSGHHVEMFAPLIRQLGLQHHYRCRVVSMCELRGFSTPKAELKKLGAEVYSVVPRRFRTTPSLGAQTSSGKPSRLRIIARDATWKFILYPRLGRWIRSRPDLVVVPNDAAYPYNLLAKMLGEEKIPFVLIQEGIRFSRPTVSDGENYGKSGAVAFATWGEASTEYFVERGIPAGILHTTGNPRHDWIAVTNLEPEARKLKYDLDLKEQHLLLLTNPIDDQGFCTTADKFQLVRRFVSGLGPLFEEGLQLTIKPHGRESIREYVAIASENQFSHQINVTEPTLPLHALIMTARAAVVFASSVGLDVLLRGRPLGVLEIPGHGYVFDYVSAGVATGIQWSQPIDRQVKELLSAPTGRSLASDSYLSRNLLTDGGATARVVALITELVEGDKSTGSKYADENNSSKAVRQCLH